MQLDSDPQSARIAYAPRPVPPSMTRRQANRAALLAQMPKGGRAAEVGVWNGGFSQTILTETRPGQLVLIDPWDLLAAGDGADLTHARQSDAAAMAAMHDSVCTRFADRTDVIIRRGFSEDVLASFPDHYFDWVYLDGNHLYDFVLRDITICLAKVRPGGVISGDDFHWERDGRRHVRDAVHDAMRAHGLAPAPRRFGQQWMFPVPVA